MSSSGEPEERSRFVVGILSLTLRLVFRLYKVIIRYYIELDLVLILQY